MKKQLQTIAERMVLLRSEYHLTVEKMGAIIGKSSMSINNIEKSVTKLPQESTIELIVNKFGTTREWLIYGIGEMLPNGKINLSISVNEIDAMKKQIELILSQYSIIMELYNKNKNL